MTQKNDRLWASTFLVLWPSVLAMLAPIGLLYLFYRLLYRNRSPASLDWKSLMFAPVLAPWKAWRSRDYQLVFSSVLVGIPFLLGALGFLVQPQESLIRMRHPSWQYWLGTNDNGQGMLSLLLLAWRNTAIVVQVALDVLLLVGITAGVACYRAAVATWCRRALDTIENIPLLFALAVLAAMGSVWLDVRWPRTSSGSGGRDLAGAALVGATIGLWLAVPMARLIADKIDTFRKEQYIDAARARRVPWYRIVFVHILWKNALGETLVLATRLAGVVVLVEVSLSYLTGIGAAVGGGGLYFSLAHMLGASRQAQLALMTLDSWWLAVVPLSAIVITILGFHLHGHVLANLLAPEAAGGADG